MKQFNLVLTSLQSSSLKGFEATSQLPKVAPKFTFFGFLRNSFLERMSVMQFSVASSLGKHCIDWRNPRIFVCKCKSKEVHPAWICQEAQNRCLASYPEIVGNSWKSNLIQFWWKLLQTWIKNRKAKSPDIFNGTFCTCWLNAFLCGKDSTNIIENALTCGILMYSCTPL